MQDVALPRPAVLGTGPLAGRVRRGWDAFIAAWQEVGTLRASVQLDRLASVQAQQDPAFAQRLRLAAARPDAF